jgi:hypothetical protein
VRIREGVRAGPIPQDPNIIIYRGELGVDYLPLNSVNHDNSSTLISSVAIACAISESDG